MKFFSAIKRPIMFSSTSKIIAIITILHLGFIILIDKVTAFAPDEENYIKVFNNLYRSGFSLEGYLGWHEESILGLRLIYLPSKLLAIIGFSDFYSVRLLSILYSMLSLFLLLKLAPDEKILKFPIRFWLVCGYVIPTIFLWTSIGLRESFILLSFVVIFYIISNPKSLSSWKQFLLMATASTFFLISKIYLYGLLLMCLVISALVLSLLRKKLEFGSLKLLSAFLIPLLLFPSMATNITAEGKRTLEVKLLAPIPIPIPTSTPTPTVTVSVPPRGQTLHDLSRQFEKNAFLYWLFSKTGIKDILDKSVEYAYLESDSAELSENVTQLQRKPASLREPLSLLLGAYNFLFLPFPFVDNGSFFLNVQSYESFVWYLFYIILVILLMGLIRGRYSLNLATLSSTLFSLGFIAVSALIEVNDGTSVRHRAVLLFGILVMLVVFLPRSASNKKGELN